MNFSTTESTTENFQISLPSVWATQLAGTIEVIFSVIAIFGNFVFVAAVILKKKLRTLANIFLVNLSFTDILAALLVSSFSIDSFFRREWHLGHGLCVVHAILHAYFSSTSLYLTAFIAINRYIYIVHRHKYKSVTHKVSVTVMLIFAWMFPLVMFSAVIPKNAEYYPSILRCQVNSSEQLLTFAVTGIVGFYLPSVITLICYTLIFVSVRKSRRRVQSHSGHNTGTHVGPSQQEVRMLKVLVAVYLLILMGYLPFVVFINVKWVLGLTPSPNVVLTIYPSLHVAGVLNPILYGANNSNFRDAYKEFLSGKTFCTNTSRVRVDARRDGALCDNTGQLTHVSTNIVTISASLGAQMNVETNGAALSASVSTSV
ncbi:melatonin receptor type 1B-B-like [Ptychodera flava]|uniref:melatonin receptor type 1B-B-like n=1 Tax=Ptychodera flava TaxID=63121 RepID=UPI00396A39CC